MKRRFAIGALFAALLSLSSYASAQVTFVAHLTGAQETPAVTSNGSGLAIFTLDASKTNLAYDVIVTGLSGITASHIHVGASGVSGAVLFPLATNSFSQLSGSITVAPGDVNNLLSGNLYINVHTVANPNGEIRGQILRPSTNAYYALLSGDQETPAVTSAGSGIATFTPDSTGSIFTYDLIVAGLTGITSSSIQSEASGTVGAVVSPLASATFNELTGSFTPSATDKTNLAAGNLAVNVLTAANPSGEILGQIEAVQNDVPPDSESNWTVPFTLNSSVSNATIGQSVTFGTATGAIDGWAASEDLQGSRPLDTYVAMAIIHPSTETGWEGYGGLYIQDIRSPIAASQSKTWSNIVVTSDLGSQDTPATIVISWPDLSNASSALSFTLQDPNDVDGDGIIAYDMRKIKSFTYKQYVSVTNPTVNSYFNVVVTNTRALPQPTLSAFTATAGASSATLAWSTDVASDTVLKYGTSADALTNTITDTNLVTAHSVALDKLTPNTTYYYQVSANAPNFTAATSAVQSFATLKSFAIVGAPAVSAITPTTATLAFKTDAAGAAVVTYGTDQANLTSAVNLTAQASQSTTLTGLTPATQYFVKIVSSAAGYENLVQTLNFTTLGDLKVNNLQIDSITETSAQITVTTSLASTITLKFGTPDLSTAVTMSDSTPSTSHVFKLSNLKGGSAYQAQATASATGAATSTSNLATFTTLSPISITTGPTVTPLTTSASVNVITDVKTTGEIDYGTTPTLGSVYKMPLAAQNHYVLISDLDPNTTYYYQVVLKADGHSTITTDYAQFKTQRVVVKGDANGDGIVNLSDVTLALQFAIGLKTPTADQLTNLDVIPVGAPDGVIDLRDVTKILRFTVGLESSL